jgi:hypothetical protein
MYNASENFKKAMLSPQYKLYIKLVLYDHKMKFIKEITKQVTKDIGTLAISSDSPIRRSFKITLDNSLGEFIFGENNLIWLNKRLKLYVGIETWNIPLEWVPQGVYTIIDPEDNHLIEGKTATINAVDKAYFMTDNRGRFVNEFIIAEGAKITDTIKLIAGKVGETLFNFDNVTDTVPYEMTYGINDNYFKAIQELAAFAKCQVYYDANGYLCLRKIDLDEIDNSPISWNYDYGSINEKLYAGNTRKMDTSKLFNDIVVIAGGSTTSTKRYRLTVDENNAIWAGHPYSVQKIGWNTLNWNDGNPDQILVTQEDCKFRAKKCLMDSLGYDEQVTLNLSPNYLHDCGDVILIKDSTNGLTGNKYIINSISLPLAPSLMTMEVSRMKKVIENWDFI